MYFSGLTFYLNLSCIISTCFFSSCIKEESFNISGVVYRDGNPVNGCTVYIRNSDYIADCKVIDSTITTHGGKYHFTDINKFSSTRQFNLVAYDKSTTSDFTLEDGKVSLKDAKSGKADAVDLVLPPTVVLRVSLDLKGNSSDTLRQLNLLNQGFGRKYNCDQEFSLKGPIFPYESGDVRLYADSIETITIRVSTAITSWPIRYVSNYTNYTSTTNEIEFKESYSTLDTIDIILK